MQEIDWNRLFDEADKSRQAAIAPYSKFRVGAALLTRDGGLFTGCNIEVSSHSLTICAERVALFKALSEGKTEIAAIAVISDAEQPCPPCGACRQVIWDFARSAVIGLRGRSGAHRIFTPEDLLPEAFDQHFLPGT